MKFTREKNINGIKEQMFELTVGEETLPGVIWTREGATGPRPLVLMGHGGSQHKKILNIRTAAYEYAAELGYAVVAIDAPGHGDRISRGEAAELRNTVGQNIAAGRIQTEGFRQRLLSQSSVAVPEWKATLDAVQQLDVVGDQGPVGYWGGSMGTAIGVPFVASEPRIKCALFGLLGMNPELTEMRAWAKSITIPVQFSFQWEDTIANHEEGIAFYEAFGSTEKSMHINPGGHVDIPLRERESWVSFCPNPGEYVRDSAALA